MKIYRIWPGTDAFEIKGVFIPWLDIIADDEAAAERGARLLMPDFNHENSNNCGLQGQQKPELLSNF